MGCSLVSHFSSGRSHICKLEGKERKKSFSLISDHPSTLPPLSTASDPTLLHPPPPSKGKCCVNVQPMSNIHPAKRNCLYVDEELDFSSEVC
ncbi:hypothetical protein MRB53_006624 [Persea americana]|uniref:Uncharacterized protein n=1 Tax=Persea americana TaxID=3435 RepID=A0ACC2MGH0_PERAE|nr:hypothetical protein MRB53_006624 [Persea americana]